VQALVNSDAGLKGIRLYVDKQNKKAQEVYKRIGMNGDHYLVYEWMKG
jgi:ribosomal protein S18 acetylase RimI-like enzyme